MTTELNEINNTLKAVEGLLNRHIIDHEKHIAEIQPIIDAYKGAGTLGNLLKWISQVIIAGGIIAGTVYTFITLK